MNSLSHLYVKMSNKAHATLSKFKNNERGASVIEWLVMAAIGIGLGVILYIALKPVVNNWVSTTNTKMTDFLNGD